MAVDETRIVKYEAYRMAKRRGEIDKLGFDVDDYEQSFLLQLHRAEFRSESGRENNKQKWSNRIVRNLANDLRRKMRTIPPTIPYEDLSIEEPNSDLVCLVYQLLDSPVSTEMELLLEFIRCDFSVTELWRQSGVACGRNAYSKRVHRAQARVRAYLREKTL